MTANQSNVRGSEFGTAEEYKTLREELLQAKRYVFERPLLIVAMAAVGGRELDREFLMLMLVLAAALLLFNFWFTVNRLASAARIAAYIQLEIEERGHGRWVGWETCLREYRRWLKEDPAKRRAEVDSALDTGAVPDALMYYPAIYLLHIGLMALAACLVVTLVLHDMTWLSVLTMVLVLSLAGCFCVYLRRYAPSKMRALIERSRVIWTRVFSQMQAKGLK